MKPYPHRKSKMLIKIIGVCAAWSARFVRVKRKDAQCNYRQKHLLLGTKQELPVRTQVFGLWAGVSDGHLAGFLSFYLG